jgi:predicted transcriptional regulator
MARKPDPVVAKRRRMVAELALRRISQAAIAEAMGISQPTVSRDLAAIEAEWRREMVEDVESKKAREIAELEEMERQVIQDMLSSRISRYRGIRARLEIKKRKAKMLGFDAPMQVESPGGDGDIRIRLLKATDKLEREEREEREEGGGGAEREG